MGNEIKQKYGELLEKCERFELKGKNMLYTSANGYMFSTMNKAGQVGIRFSETIKKKYIEEYKTAAFTSYGATMRGYILITDEMWKNEQNLIELLNESFDYVHTLKAK